MQPTRFQTIINQRELGVTIPPMLLGLADEVIGGSAHHEVLPVSQRPVLPSRSSRVMSMWPTWRAISSTRCVTIQRSVVGRIAAVEGRSSEPADDARYSERSTSAGRSFAARRPGQTASRLAAAMATGMSAATASSRKGDT